MWVQISQNNSYVVANCCNSWMAITQGVTVNGDCCAEVSKCLFRLAQLPQSESNVVSTFGNIWMTLTQDIQSNDKCRMVAPSYRTS